MHAKEIGVVSWGEGCARKGSFFMEGLEPFHAISRRVQNLAQESAKRARETKDENRSDSQGEIAK